MTTNKKNLKKGIHNIYHNKKDDNHKNSRPSQTHIKNIRSLKNPNRLTNRRINLADLYILSNSIIFKTRYIYYLISQFSKL